MGSHADTPVGYTNDLFLVFVCTWGAHFRAKLYLVRQYIIESSGSVQAADALFVLRLSLFEARSRSTFMGPAGQELMS